MKHEHKPEQKTGQRHINEPKKHEHVNRHEVLEAVLPLIENTAMRFDLIPVEVDFCKENHRWYLRIYLYSYNHSVTLEDCEHVSRSLSDFLDELIPVKYYLEVSSPGLDRTLKSNREFLIFQGREIVLKLKNSIDETNLKKFTAKILDFDENLGLRILRLQDNKEFIIKQDNIHIAKLYIGE